MRVCPRSRRGRPAGAGHFCRGPSLLGHGRAKEGDAWFTVMGNVNTVAVAALTDCACVVLCHGAGWDAGALQRAGEQGVALYTCPLPEFEAAYLAAAKLGLPLPQA